MIDWNESDEKDELGNEFEKVEMMNL